MIDGDGLQFTDFRPKENKLEDAFISVLAVLVLILMALGGIALIVRYSTWWSYLIGTVVGGVGVIGLLAGFSEFIKFLDKQGS